jgi:hypothetical protein
LSPSYRFAQSYPAKCKLGTRRGQRRLRGTDVIAKEKKKTNFVEIELSLLERNLASTI